MVFEKGSANFLKFFSLEVSIEISEEDKICVSIGAFDEFQSGFEELNVFGFLFMMWGDMRAY